jgi:hypothetical protein
METQSRQAYATDVSDRERAFAPGDWDAVDMHADTIDA